MGNSEVTEGDGQEEGADSPLGRGLWQERMLQHVDAVPPSGGRLGDSDSQRRRPGGNGHHVSPRRRRRRPRSLIRMLQKKVAATSTARWTEALREWQWGLVTPQWPETKKANKTYGEKWPSVRCIRNSIDPEETTVIDNAASPVTGWRRSFIWNLRALLTLTAWRIVIANIAKRYSK